MSKDILFVCTGNTCRSPMAETIAKTFFSELEISSSGISVMSPSGAAKNAINAAEKYGADLTDHISSLVPSPLIGPNLEELGTRFPDMSEVYSKRMQGVIRECAAKCNVDIKEGVYVQFTGPAYETPAEVRMARTLGGDAVGMSTACEAMAACHMGLEIGGISCITNMAAGISEVALDHKEVQETADMVAKSFKALVAKVIVNM